MVPVLLSTPAAPLWIVATAVAADVVVGHYPLPDTELGSGTRSRVSSYGSGTVRSS